MTSGSSTADPTASSPAGPCGESEGPHASGSQGAGGGRPPAGALQLLRVLQEQLQGRSDVMCSRLAAMERGLMQLCSSLGGPKQQQQSWQSYFASPAWALECSVARAVAPGEGGEGFQIKGTDAVAAAVWACVAHWDGAAADATVAAVRYGGDTDTIACMAGALVGALRGSSWLPDEWQAQLEGDAAGVSFFNTAAVQAALQDAPPVASAVAAASSGGDASRAVANQAGDAAAAGAGEALVHTTRNMGRQGAVVLARLLAQLDCRT